MTRYRLLGVCLAVLVLAGATVAATRVGVKWQVLQHGWQITANSQYSETRMARVTAKLKNNTGKYCDQVTVEASILRNREKVRSVTGGMRNTAPGDVVSIVCEPCIHIDSQLGGPARQGYTYRIDSIKWVERTEETPAQ